MLKTTSLIVLIVNFMYLCTVQSFSQEEVFSLAEKELLDFPDFELLSIGKRYKKFTRRSLEMSKRNALYKNTMRKLMGEGRDLIQLEDMVLSILSNASLEMSECLNTHVACQKDNKYRTIDGTCNNLEHVRWGSTGSQLRRLLKPTYGNAESNPATKGKYRKRGCTRSGNPLPNPREVSNVFHPDLNVSSGVATHMHTQMGQFVDHDLSLTPESHATLCCEDNTQDGCNAIPINSEDPFYSQYKQTCLEFTRSEQFCSSNPREQFNGITSYVDASNVYGSDSTTLASLKNPDNSHLLKVSLTKNGKALLPKNTGGLYFAGDVRASEMPGLASMHTLFVREHNRIAKEMLQSNPEIPKETIFEETRRIVGAEMQNIVFDQYLSTILSDRTMESYHLGLKRESFYNHNVNADITNAFATAAYRFGHSMIQGDILRLALSSQDQSSTFSLKDAFFNMENYEANDGKGFEEILNGLINQAAQDSDRFIIDDVTNHLFNGGASFGSDLIARNIHRGRDHGLPTYGYWRKFCSLKSLCNWQKKPSDISSENWNLLQKFYKNPNDIDLFTAGLAETPEKGSVLGRTFSCIIAHQFRDLKHGDRFFFTHVGHTVVSFTHSQVSNIKTRHLGQIICDNTDIKRVRRNVFDLNSEWIDCPSSSSLNIGLFVGNKRGSHSGRHRKPKRKH